MASNVSIARRLASQTWGPVQFQRKAGPGIWFFSTASHGGYVVDTDIRPVFKGCETDVLIRAGGHYLYPNEQHFAVFEEDCEYAKVEWLCPDIFKKMYRSDNTGLPFDEWVTNRQAELRRSLEQWNSEWLAAHPLPSKG